MSKKLPRWFTLLSAPVRAGILASAAECGFREEELDAWCADTFTTAHRSPQGLILRLKKRVELPGAAAPAQEQELFSTTK